MNCGNMKLGISDLVIEKNNDIIWLLKENNINYIEIVLPKHMDWKENNLNELYDYVNKLKKHNIQIISTQAIFFNSGVKEFTGNDFINHINKVSEVCKNIGVKYIVLGAPAMRTENSFTKLKDTFEYIDNILKINKQTLLLEPNSKVYNGKYFHTLNEIINFIKKYNFTNIKSMIDTHNLILENENIIETYLQNKEYIKHIHVSEVNLEEFKPSEEHINLSNILFKEKYDGLIIYEAKPSTNIENNIKEFNKIYAKRNINNSTL
jgi:sugar phosphate isomerase/epimerase